MSQILGRRDRLHARAPGTVGDLLNTLVPRAVPPRQAAPVRGPRQKVAGTISVGTAPTRAAPG